MSDLPQRRKAHREATECHVSERSPMYTCNYPSISAPTGSRHVIPDHVPLPCVAVWHKEAKTVFYNPIVRIDRTSEASGRHRSDTADGVKKEDSDGGTVVNHEPELRSYDVIRHGGGVSFRAATAGDGGNIERSHWVSTPRTLTFNDKELEICLLDISTEGGRSVIEFECLCEGGTAHIEYFKSETSSFVPRFIDDPSWKRGEALTCDLEKSQTGQKPWEYGGGSYGSRRSTKGAEASVRILPSDSAGMGSHSCGAKTCPACRVR